MPWKRSFEAFVDVTAEATSSDRLFEVLLDSLLSYGFDMVNFSVQRDDDLRTAHQGFGIISTYPTQWRDYYRERELVKIDPVVRWASSLYGPFRWRDIGRRTELTRQQTSLLLKAEDAGLHHGIGIPFAGSGLQIAGVAMATSDKQLARAVNFDLLSAYCNQFYKAYKRVNGAGLPAPPAMACLSGREQKIITRIAEGRSNGQIAANLGVGTDTVDYYIRSAFRKLGVHSRVAAVAVCLRFGLIDLL